MPPGYTKLLWSWPYRFLKKTSRAGTEFYLLIDIEELHYERYLLTTLMDNGPDKIFYKDTKSRFIKVNKAVSELYRKYD